MLPTYSGHTGRTRPIGRPTGRRYGDPVTEPPKGFDRTVRLRDGRVVVVRPLTRRDAPELGEAIRTADPVTLRRRFCGQGWRFAYNGVVFTGASSVAVTRYRHRGSNIPAPWTPKPAAAATGS